MNYALPLDQLPDPLPIVPLAKPFDVTIRPPGSKSITNRAYVLAALQGGWVINPLSSDDADLLRRALTVLGASFSHHSETPNEVWVDGVHGKFPRGGSINLGDGGAPTRFMIAAACLAAEDVVIDGSRRMRERPVAEGIDMLRQIGAGIDYLEQPARLPVRVRPSPNLQGGVIEVSPTSSSQFVSAVMMIGPHLPRGIEIRFTGPITSESYVNMTVAVMRAINIEVLTPGGNILIPPQALDGGRIIVEPDATSATYWLAAGALIHSAQTRIMLPRASGSMFTNWQGDWAFRDILNRMGAHVDHSHVRSSLTVRAGRTLRAVDENMTQMPDAAQSLAVLCAFADKPSRLTGLHTLRVKETDRIAALANELRKVGCTVETGDDWISIEPVGGLSRPAFDPVIIETYNDHRMAMAFAILGLVRPGLSIRNPACVAKSYPDFWKDFQKLYDHPAS